MRPVHLIGSTLLLTAGLALPAFSQTTGAPVTGVPGQDQAVAGSCTETELAAAQDLVAQVPESQRASAQTIYNTAEDYQNDNNLQLCAQKLQELRTLAQSGIGGATATTGGVAATSDTPAQSCTETELTRVGDMIGEAPEAMQSDLRQQLRMAQEQQNDNDLQMCAQTLAEIEDMIGTGTTGSVGSTQ